MIVSGMSGNELFCLNAKGFAPGEIVVGNSVYSLGVIGGLGAFGRNLAGGEIANVTSLLSEGRHAAIERMENEAKKLGANGVASVVSEVRSLGGYTEFLSQGTAVHGGALPFFSSATSGMELYTHLDAGYQPIRFSMGIVAYALGVGRGLVGSLRTLGRGEVKEFSQMYNDIRHTALDRLKAEAASLGANAVVDTSIRILPYGPGSVELLMTGTASHHPRLGLVGGAAGVHTSELSGEELWNLARMGYAPVQLCMATSVYSLGVIGGIGTMLQGLSRGELPELTSLIYGARENCLDLLRKEAESVGAERVIGNKLSIRELAPGLIEVVAIGTAVRRLDGMEPQTPLLIPQAIIVDRDSTESDPLTRREQNVPGNALQSTAAAAQGSVGALQLVMVVVAIVVMMCGAFVAAFVSLVSGS
jgi:uncharacterized protein YbjQ (UPF0145 family)